jgi:hypothetical protein
MSLLGQLFGPKKPNIDKLIRELGHESPTVKSLEDQVATFKMAHPMAEAMGSVFSRPAAFTIGAQTTPELEQLKSLESRLSEARMAQARVRQTALDTLKELTGQDFGLDVGKWQEWRGR